MSSLAAEIPPKEHLRSVALLLLVAVLWSLGGVLIKLIDWHPMAIAGMRSAIAVPVVMLCAGWPQWPFSRLQWAGAIAYVGTVMLFVAATRLTTAANAIFLQYTAPIYVALLAPWFLREPSRRSDWLAIIAALGGIALFFMDRLTLAGMWGNVLAILSGVSFAVMVLFMRKEKGGAPMQVVLLGNITTAIIGIPFAIHAGYPGDRAALALLVLGIVQLGLSYVLYAVAIRRVTALEATLITLLEPVLNPVWVMLAVGEKPGAWAVVGGGVVLVAVLLRGVIGALRRGTSPT
ncbi:DMT family transporter [Verrucomicrobiota bacterium sgz303538]